VEKAVAARTKRANANFDKIRTTDIGVVFVKARGATSCVMAFSDERIVNPSLGSDLKMPLLPSRTVLVQRWGQYANDTAVGTGSVGCA